MIIMLLILFNKARNEGYHRHFTDSDSSSSSDSDGPIKRRNPKEGRKVFAIYENKELDE